MTEKARRLLEDFDSLPESERRQVLVDLGHHTALGEHDIPGDADLVAAADEVFLELDQGRPMAKDYVERVEGVFRVAGTRVSLDSIICRFREGLSAESIAESFPALTLEQVYGGIAFYLANQQTLDEYLREGEKLARELQSESRRQNADLIARLQRARHESQIPG
jgi:uncharacterized protein (DUF433 family)